MSEYKEENVIEINDTISQTRQTLYAKEVNNIKTNRYNIDNMSLEDVEEIIYKYNELYPEDSLYRELFKYVNKYRTKSCEL